MNLNRRRTVLATLFTSAILASAGAGVAVAVDAGTDSSKWDSVAPESSKWDSSVDSSKWDSTINSSKWD